MATPSAPPVWSDMDTPSAPASAAAGTISGTSGNPRLHQGGYPVVTPDSVFCGERWRIPLSLLHKWYAVPTQEISRRCFAEIPLLGQAVMRRSAVTINSMMSRADHDNEAVMLQLAKPAHDVAACAVLPKLFLGIACGDVNGILALDVVPALQCHIERPRAVGQRFPGRSFHRVLEYRHERRQSTLVARHSPPTSALMILRNRSRSTSTAFGRP